MQPSESELIDYGDRVEGTLTLNVVEIRQVYKAPATRRLRRPSPRVWGRM